MKKLLSLVVALALVLTSMSMTAFAAVSDDVTDAKVKAAVDRLVAFKLVNGMEDGKFHPEKKLTRAEASKLIVVALGLGQAADAAKGATQFSDVSASHWASGFINVAAGQGIVKGTGNGQFSPEAEVTYAQVVTMLVRAIGYKDQFLPGTWPGNYVAKAADAGITDDVTFTPDGTADRGAVALMVDNTLDAKVVKVTGYDEGNGKTIWNVTNTSLLKEKLGYDKIEKVRVIANNRLNDGLLDDQVELLDEDADRAAGSNDYTGNTKIVNDTLNSEDFLGLQVKAYFDGDDIIYMEKDEKAVVTTDYICELDGSKAKLKVADKKYEIDGNYDDYIFVNGDDNSGANDVGDEIVPNSFGKFVIKNNKIIWADIFNPSDAGLSGGKDNFVVTKVDTTDKVITGVIVDDSSASKDEEINLADDYDKYMIFTKEMKPLKVEDIKVNDVLYVVNYDIDGDDTAIVIAVQNNTVTGKFEIAKQDSIKVGGKSYDLAKYNDGSDRWPAAFTSNNFDDVPSYAAAFSAGSSFLEDLDEADVTAITNIIGKVVFFKGDVKATSGDMYGVVLRNYGDERIKIYYKKADGTGEAKTFTAEKEANIDSVGDGAFIKFKLNKDGKIAEDKVTVMDTVIAGGFNAIVGQDFDTGVDTITVDGGVNYKVADDVTIIEYLDTDDGTPIDPENFTVDPTVSVDDSYFNVFKWEDIKDKDARDFGSDSIALFIDSAKNNVDAILVMNNDADFGSDEKAAYVLDKWSKGDTVYVNAKLYGEADFKEYKFNGAASAVIKEEAAVVRIGGDGKLRIVAGGQSFTSETMSADLGNDLTTVSAVVYDKDGDNVSLWHDGGETYYKKTSKTIIYKGGDPKSMSNIIEGTTRVRAVIEDGAYIRVMEIQ